MKKFTTTGAAPPEAMDDPAVSVNIASKKK